RLRGMSERYGLWKDLFKPAIIPVITVLGMFVRSWIRSTVVIVILFGIPGVGHFLVDSIRARDSPVVHRPVIMIGFFVVLANTISDLLLLWHDHKRRFNRTKDALKRHQQDGEI